MAKEAVGVLLVAEGIGDFTSDMTKAEKAYDKVTTSFSKGSAAVASAMNKITAPIRKVSSVMGKISSTIGNKVTPIIGKLRSIVGKVREGFKKLTSPIRKAAAIMGKLTDAAKKVGKGIFNVGKTLAKAAVAGVAVFGAAIVGAVVALGKLAMEAAPLEGIGIAFNKMAERSGLSLDAMRKAAAGTISDFDLMKSANVALTGAGENLGKEFGTKLPALLEIARAAAKATGQDVGFMFESLVTGIKRGSPMLIDNTGLQLKMSEANAALAEQLGKTVDELTAEEKQIALLDATLAAGKAMVDDFGGGQLTAAERMAQFQAQVQNTKDQVGLALLPALQAILEPLSSLATDIGPKVIEWAQLLGEWLGEKIPIAVEKARTFFEETWPVIQATIADFWEMAQPILIQVADWFTKEGPGALDELGAAFEEVWAFIQEQVEKVVEWFQENLPLIQETGEILVAFWENNVVPALDNVWEIIKTIVGTAIDIVMGIVKTVMLLITGDWEGAWEEIESIAFTIWEDIKTAAAEFIEGVLTIIGSSTDELVKDWQGVWDLIKIIIETAWEAIKPAVDTALDILSSIISGNMAFIAGDWEGVWEEIKNVAFTIWESIKTMAAAFIEWVLNEIGSSTDELIEDWQGVWDLAKLIVETVWGNIVELVSTKMGEVIGAITSKLDTIKAAGAAIVDAIRSGIANAWGGLIEWFRSKLADLANMLPWSEPRDPRSPLRHLSKAGEAIVGNIAAGFDTGAAKFASSLAGMMAMTGPMMAAAPRLVGATSTSTTTHVNINTGDIVNGMDVAQLRTFILQTVKEAI